jgi:chromosomal replication initiator protein DnaA
MQILGGILRRSTQVNFVVYLSNRQRADLDDTGPLFAESRTTGDQAISVSEDRTDDSHEEGLFHFSEWDPRVTDIRRRTSTDLVPLHAAPLDRRYTFETFVTGPDNHFAYAAALAVVDAPGTRFNPLVIYGGVGLGKTHLLQAVGHDSQITGRNVVYITAEAFANELIEAIRAQKTDDFRARFRSIDVLLMDDIQFMAGKTSTEEEFYHTFNAITSQGGQVVVVCNSPPRMLTKLDERIRTRLEGGLLADIQPPAFETRLAIIMEKSAAQGTPIPEDVACVLAHHATTNVRELEGLLNQVLARTVLTHEPMTLALARQVIDKHATSPRPAPQTIRHHRRIGSYRVLSPAFSGRSAGQKPLQKGRPRPADRDVSRTRRNRRLSPADWGCARRAQPQHRPARLPEDSGKRRNG